MTKKEKRKREPPTLLNSKEGSFIEKKAQSVPLDVFIFLEYRNTVLLRGE
jgi:hypothetical protein